MKEDLFYIPLNSLNYSNILSSESVSPHAFYGQRSFGFRRYEKIASVPFSNTLLAYSKPVWTSLQSADRDEYLMFLALPFELLPSEGQKTYEKEKVTLVQFAATVFLDWQRCYFIVESEDVRKRVIATTGRTVESKLAVRYNAGMKTLDQIESDMIDWSDSMLAGVLDEKIAHPESIRFDKQFNKTRGFFYGYLTGELDSPSSELVEARKLFQRFINLFSVALNEVSPLVSSKRASKDLIKKSIREDLRSLSDIARGFDLLLNTDQKKSKVELVSESFGISEEHLKILEGYSHGNGRKVLEILSDYARKNSKTNVSLRLHELLQELEYLMEAPQKKSFEKISDRFESIRSEVEGLIEEKRKGENGSALLSEWPFSFGSVARVDFSDRSKKPADRICLDIIVNELIQRTEMVTTDDIAQERLSIIESVGSALRKHFQRDAREIQYLRELYQSVTSVGGGFKVSDAPNTVLQQFACFCHRYNELSKFQDYLDKNGIYERAIAYAIWGAAYGYSALSKLMLEPLFGNEDALHRIMPVLAEVRSKRELTLPTVEGQPDPEPVTVDLDLDDLSANTRVEEPGDASRSSVAGVQSEQMKQEDDLTVKAPGTFNTGMQRFGSLVDKEKLFSRPEWKQTLKDCFAAVHSEGSADLEKDFAQQRFEAQLQSAKASRKLSRFGEKKMERAIELFREAINP